MTDTETTTPPALKTYTVLGYWDDSDRPVSVGVIEGNHDVDAGESLTEGGDWATSVEAEDAEWAEGLAIAEMRATLVSDSDDEEEENDNEEGDDEA